MSVQEIAYVEAKNMVVARLRDWVNQMPVAQRKLRIIWKKWLLSPMDMLREVEHSTEIGQQIVAAEIRAIGETQGIQYVVQG